MKVEIGQYVLKSDSTCFILVLPGGRGKTKNGEMVDKVVGYYSTIESVLNAVPERALMTSDVESLAEVVEELKKYRKIVEDALR